MASRKRSRTSGAVPRSRRAPAGLETTKVVGGGGSGSGSGEDADASSKHALRWNAARDRALLKVLRQNCDDDGACTMTPTEVAEELSSYDAFAGVEHLLNAQAVSVRARRLRKVDDGAIDVPKMARAGGYSPSAELLNE